MINVIIFFFSTCFLTADVHDSISSCEWTVSSALDGVRHWKVSLVVRRSDLNPRYLKFLRKGLFPSTVPVTMRRFKQHLSVQHDQISVLHVAWRQTLFFLYIEFPRYRDVGVFHVPTMYHISNGSTLCL